MTISIHETFLPQNDPEASLRFYRGLLGFEIRGDVDLHGFRWITVGPTRQSDISIVLYPIETAPGLTEDERQAVAQMMRKGTFASLNLATTDLDAVFTRLRDAGAEILQEPTDHDYGIRDCAVRDPAGNLLRIQQAR